MVAAARSGGGGEERRCGEELGAHDRGGVRSGGAAAQGKGQGQLLTSQVRRCSLQRESRLHPQMQPAACIAAVATRPAEQAESETVRQGACGKAAAAGVPVFRKGQEGTRNEE